MRRVLLYFVQVGILVAAAVWFADRPGKITIDWQGWRVETSVGVAVLLLVAIAILLAGFLNAWTYLRRALRHLRDGRARRRRAQGYKALTAGLVAVAAGDPEEARRKARVSERLLDEPPLTLLLSAQASQLAGDEGAAERYFTDMLKRPETEFLGLRGLIVQALKAGEEARALTLAKRAFEIRPKTLWVVEALVDLHTRHGEWEEAQAGLERARKAKLLPPEEIGRRLAAVLVERARLSARDGRHEEAHSQAARAHELDPALIPATAALAHALVRLGKRKKARRLIERVWAKTPHALLAQAYAEACEAGSPETRLKAVEALQVQNATDPESRLALAEAALAAGRYEMARGLAAALAKSGSARAYRLLAGLETEQGKPEAVRRWLDAAAGATEPAWVCGNCGAIAEEWSARCANCGAIARFSWSEPRHGRPIEADAAALAAPDGASGRDGDAVGDGAGHDDGARHALPAIAAHTAAAGPGSQPVAAPPPHGAAARSGVATAREGA